MKNDFEQRYRAIIEDNVNVGKTNDGVEFLILIVGVVAICFFIYLFADNISNFFIDRMSVDTQLKIEKTISFASKPCTIQDDKEKLNKLENIKSKIVAQDKNLQNKSKFNIYEIDDEKVWKALDEAQMGDYVRSLPEGLDTTIGERGVRLSGGQRQRIGIARALYEDPELLIFDEATSALDNETEAAIMESVNSLHGKKTMIIIAHRLSTIKECDIVYRVENGKINQVDEIV